MQGILDLQAPLLVDPIVRCDIVLADSPKHELLLEARDNPDLLTRSADCILGLCSVEPPSRHQLKCRSRQHSIHKKATGVAEALTYAATTAALRDNPWLQCTKTVPPSAMA